MWITNHNINLSEKTEFFLKPKTIMKIIRGLLTTADFNFDGFVISNRIYAIRREITKFSGYLTEQTLYSPTINITAKYCESLRFYYITTREEEFNYIYVNTETKVIFAYVNTKQCHIIRTNCYIYDLILGVTQCIHYRYDDNTIWHSNENNDWNDFSHGLIEPVNYRHLDKYIEKANSAEARMHEKK